MPTIPGPDRLIPMIEGALHGKLAGRPYFPDAQPEARRISSVLLLLGQTCRERGFDRDACFILNKRSENVRQTGDLCCPGGGAEPRRDKWFARLLHLPYSPLRRWSYWKEWRRRTDADVRRLPLLFATSLRESYEEMRLNPFRVRFLGPLAPQELFLFQKTVFPMVGWVHGQNRFQPNWEVAKIVYLPLAAFFDSSHYRRFRFKLPGKETSPNDAPVDYPCFVYRDGGHTEILWGATYRIVVSFVETVFDFRPPELHTLDVYERDLDPGYMKAGRS